MRFLAGSRRALATGLTASAGAKSRSIARLCFCCWVCATTEYHRARFGASNSLSDTSLNSCGLDGLRRALGNNPPQPGTGKPPASRRRLTTTLCERQGPGSNSDLSAVAAAATQKKNNHEPNARRPGQDRPCSGSSPITTTGLRPGRHGDCGARPTHGAAHGRDLPAWSKSRPADARRRSRDRPDDAGDRP